MITRPLDLASKLRPEPQNFGALFFVNAGLIVLFFALFGSRFVLAPGLGIDFRPPRVEGANANARPPTHVISVMNSGLVLTSTGPHKMAELPAWFEQQARGTESSTLLMHSEALVPYPIIAKIAGQARHAGFQHVLSAAEEPAPTLRRSAP